MKKLIIGLLFVMSLGLFATETFAHSGGTDYCGCHNNRRTGDYHCHTRKQRGNGCPM
jgi:hypothetical protein